MNGHPSPNILERLSAGDIGGAARDDAAQHVERCSFCRALLDELLAAREARLAAVPPDRFIALVGERRDRDADLTKRRQRRYTFGTITMATAVAAALLLIPRSGPDMRLKGAGVSLHRNRAGEVRVLAPSDTIRAGDGLRVVVTLSQPSPVSVWFVDAGGRVDSLLHDGPVSIPGGEQALPGSVTVEAPCSDLQVIIGVGDAAGRSTETTLRRAVVGGVPTGTDWLPRGTVVRSLRCE